MSSGGRGASSGGIEASSCWRVLSSGGRRASSGGRRASSGGRGASSGGRGTSSGGRGVLMLRGEETSGRPEFMGNTALSFRQGGVRSRGRGDTAILPRSKHNTSGNLHRSRITALHSCSLLKGQENYQLVIGFQQIQRKRRIQTRYCYFVGDSDLEGATEGGGGAV